MRPSPSLDAAGSDSILAGYVYHLNVMPLDARMLDPGALVRGFTGTTTAGRDGLRRTIQRITPPAP
ncbi:MAG TPA: hypothetical protein VE464_01740 [Streptosporangiaceae bacterium]|nr:hypothetical protein [Streptosporangiaceae bacterium]